MPDFNERRYIIGDCFLDVENRTLCHAVTGKKKRIGKRLAVILQVFLDNPNSPVSLTAVSEALIRKESVDDLQEVIDEEAFKKQITRLKSALEEVEGSKEVWSLFSGRDGKWIYHQPREVFERKMIDPSIYYSQGQKKYDDYAFPRLICTYEAPRTGSINEVLDRFLNKGVRLLFLTGEAGIGKSELAFSVGRKLSQLGFHVAKLTYEGSMRDAVLKLYPDIMGSSAQISFEKKLETLIRSYDGEYVIVDGFYDPSRTFLEMQKDEVFQKLLGSNLNLLFVTRYQHAGSPSFYEVLPLLEEQQVSLMRGGGLAAYTDEQLAVLCRLVGGNTLLCDLIGKLLRNPYAHISYNDMETILKNNQLSRSTVNVYTEKDRSYREEPIYQQLCSLCGTIAITEEEKGVLNAASFLPLEGMDERAFSGFCGCDANMLTALHNKGLLKSNDAGKVLLHALYTLYYRDPLNNSGVCKADVSGFLDALCDHFNNGDLSDRTLNDSIRLTLSRAYQEEKNQQYKAKLGLFLSCYLGLSGRYQDAYDVELECIRNADSLDKELLAKLYKDIGISAGRLGHGREAVTYVEDAVSILRELGDSVALLQAENTLAYTYGKAGEFEKQKARAEEAIRTLDYSNHPVNLARILNNLADSEYHLKEYAEAEKHITDVIQRYEKLEEIPLIWMIQAKRLLGMILFKMGKKEDGFKTVSVALEDAQDALESDHLERMRLYSCLGDMTEGSEAAHYYELALKCAMRNPMIFERLFQSEYEGRKYLVLVSEEGTAYQYEVPDDWTLENEPIKKSDYNRIITSK